MENIKHTWQTDLLDQKLSEELLAMGDLILVEVLQGFRSDKDYHTAKTFLGTLAFHQMGGVEIAVQSARLYISYMSGPEYRPLLKPKNLESSVNFAIDKKKNPPPMVLERWVTLKRL